MKEKYTKKQIKKLQSSIEYELEDLQYLEHFAQQGLSIQDWIKHKSVAVDFLEERLDNLISVGAKARGESNEV